MIVAQLAGIMGAKRTADLIPLCHTLALSGVDVDFGLERKGEEAEAAGGWVKVRAKTECVGGTGVEVSLCVGVRLPVASRADLSPKTWRSRWKPSRRRRSRC